MFIQYRMMNGIKHKCFQYNIKMFFSILLLILLWQGSYTQFPRNIYKSATNATFHDETANSNGIDINVSAIAMTEDENINAAIYKNNIENIMNINKLQEKEEEEKEKEDEKEVNVIKMWKLQRKPLNRSQQLMTITPIDQLNDVRNDSRAMHDVLQDVVVAVDERRDTYDIMMRANDGNILSEDSTKSSQRRKGDNFINTDDNNDNNNVKYKTGNDKNGNENVNDAQDYHFEDRNTTMRKVITAKTVDSLNAGSNNAVDDADEIDGETKDFDNKSDNDMVNDNVAKWQQDMTAVLQQQLIYQFAIKYKQISRITLFTCRRTLPTAQLPLTARDMVEFLRQMYSRSGFNLPEIVKPSSSHTTATKSPIPLTVIPDKSERNAERTANSSLMVKIVKIDQLIIKRRPSDTDNSLRRDFNVRSGRPSDRSTFTNANWLDQQLKASIFKQIVVLDLACGAASRRVLEMVSRLLCN
uniref:Uncharacterized protein n=1 Tax=Glossina austeni TaxID=7395 RepID=A0A1A9VFA0_GLOAU